MNIDKFKREIEFSTQIAQVFEKLEDVDVNVIYQKNPQSKEKLLLTNLFACLYFVSENVEDTLSFFDKTERNDILRVLCPIGKDGESIQDIFDLNPINYKNHDELYLRASYYQKLLALMIRYKKHHNPDWSERNIIYLLIEKNKKYGDAILNPKRFFCKDVSIQDVILSRLDEKISRRIQDDNNEDEDILTDIIGYLVFLNIIHL